MISQLIVIDFTLERKVDFERITGTDSSDIKAFDKKITPDYIAYSYNYESPLPAGALMYKLYPVHPHPTVDAPKDPRLEIARNIHLKYIAVVQDLFLKQVDWRGLVSKSTYDGPIPLFPETLDWLE